MSKAATAPIPILKGVEVSIQGQSVTVKGPGGSLSQRVHPSVKLRQADEELTCSSESDGIALVGTTRALVQNMMLGVTKGFERKLQLVGVGYRAQMRGKLLNLTLGYSHPIDFPVPEDVSIETPSQTEIVVKGIDKQRVGQTAASIRAYRPPEPYKGKGIRYAGEHIRRKAGKTVAK